MLGLSPDQAGHLFIAANASLVLVICAATSWLHKHRHTVRGVIRRLLWYL
jgi:hypothetical protein